MRTRLFLIPGLVLAAALFMGGLQNALAQEKGADGTKSFTYKGDLELLVNYPAKWDAKDQRSAIIFFGGGWSASDQKLFQGMAEYLAKRGMVAIRAEFSTKNPADAVGDARAAIKWVRDNAGKLGVNPNKIAAGGEHSGAHLAIAAYTAPNANRTKVDPKLQPNSLVLINPLLDTRQHIDRFSDVQEAQRMSPAHNLRGGIVPTMVLFGEDAGDPNVIYQLATGSFANSFMIFVAPKQKYSFYNKSPYKESALSVVDHYLVKTRYLTGNALVKYDPKGKILSKQQWMAGPKDDKPKINLPIPSVGTGSADDPDDNTLPKDLKPGDPRPPGLIPGGANPPGTGSGNTSGGSSAPPGFNPRKPKQENPFGGGGGQNPFGGGGGQNPFGGGGNPGGSPNFGGGGNPGGSPNFGGGRR